jgi:hypothetical protein
MYVIVVIKQDHQQQQQHKCGVSKGAKQYHKKGQ